MTRRELAALALAPVAGTAAVVAATGKGLYVSPDGAFYVGTARNLVDGRGFIPPPGLPPLGHFPPLFTLALTAVARLCRVDALTAARVVNVVAFSATVLLVGLLVRGRTGSLGAGVVASLLAVAAVDLLTYSASALSEPLFVLLAVAGLAALAAHLQRRRPPLLAAAAALVAAACLTRYVGLALVAAGVAGLLWWGRDRLGRAALEAAAFLAVSVGPLVAWLSWAGGRRGGAASDRTVAVHLFGTTYLGQAVRPFSRWLVPWPHPPIGLAVALGVVAAGVVLGRSRGRAAPSHSPLSWLLAAFALAYLCVLLADRALLDASGRLDARFLAPLHVVAILLVLPALWRPDLRRPAVVGLVGVLVLAQVADAAVWTAGGITDAGVARRGYAADAFRRSAVVAEVAHPDVLRPLYTNAVDAVYFLTGRTLMPIPAKADYLTGEANPHYGEELAAMRVALQDPQGRLLFLDAVTFRRSFQPTRAELEAALPLEVVAHDTVGTAYRLR